MIVIHGKQPLEIGKAYRIQVSDARRVDHLVAFRVVREATHEDYRAGVIEHGGVADVELPYNYFVEMD